MMQSVRNFLSSLLEIAITVGVAVGTVMLIRSYIIQPFLVNGKSMEPSFFHGDYLLVDELSYRVREPKRGEVIVFKHDASTFYIKRIIGLPEETVTIEGGKVKITDAQGETEVLSEEYIVPGTTFGTFKVTLGPDEYYVMGDNRNFSLDSRRWGPLEQSRITGVVRFRLWPIDHAAAIMTPSYGTSSL